MFDIFENAIYWGFELNGFQHYYFIYLELIYSDQHLEVEGFNFSFI